MKTVIALFAVVFVFWAGGSAQTLESSGIVHVQRNEVLVRVIVRDSKGRAVTNLEKSNFRLFDNGRLQSINGFTVERFGEAKESGSAGQAASSAHGVGRAQPSPPKRYLALYFDDLNLTFGNLAQSRAAAERFLPAALARGGEVGIFTASGKGEVDFTADLDKLHQGLQALAPRSRVSFRHGCPNLDPYEAYMVAEAHDPSTTSLALAQTQACLCHIDLLADGIATSNAPKPPSMQLGPMMLPGGGGGGASCPQALQYAEGQAAQLLAQVNMQSRYALGNLEKLAARMSSLPGEKTVVLVSPGFFSMSLRYELNQVVDLALRSQVTISSLDAKGLVAGGIEASDGADGEGQASLPETLSAQLDELQQENLTSSDDAMAELASATGGIFFHDDNDFEHGFREAGAPPEATYLLAFTPDRLKPDGQFHTIKVELAGNARGTIEARRGYYAPSKALEAKARAADEIGQAVFSDKDLEGIPVVCGAQHPKPGELSIFTRVDLQLLRFKKEHGRNVDDLSVVVALFDPSGNYVTGREQTAKMHLSDAELGKLRRSGIVFRNDLKVKSGVYTVRIVVRSADMGKMSALTQRIAMQ